MFVECSVDVIKNTKLLFTPPSLAWYTQPCNRRHIRAIDDDDEIRAVEPTFWLRDQENKADLVQTVSVTINFERGSRYDEAFAYGYILAALDKEYQKQQKETPVPLVTALALTALSVVGLWTLVRAMRC